MRCRKCGEKAVINMRQHRLSLCSQHFQEWLINQTKRFIEKYRMFGKEDRLLLAVSGGKDSLALWDVLWQLGYQVDGLFIHLGIDKGLGYSDRSQKFTQQFAKKRNLRLIIHDVQKTFGESVPEVTYRRRRSSQKMCAICGLVKRHVFNEIASQGGYDVLLTAHNLDDEVALLLANTLEWSLNRLARGQPILPAGAGFVKKVKPFCRFYERETAAYSLLRGIEYIQEECPFSNGNKQLVYKAHLNEWEDEMPGVKLRFYINYLSALEQGAFPNTQESEEEMMLQRCPSCGQPTITGDLCAFCRLWIDDPR